MRIPGILVRRIMPAVVVVLAAGGAWAATTPAQAADGGRPLSQRHDRVDGPPWRTAAVDAGQQGNRGLSAIQAAAVPTSGARFGLMAVHLFASEPFVRVLVEESL